MSAPLDGVARLIRAAEAFEDGEVELALKIAHDLRDELSYGEPSPRCRRCGLRFRWPGDLDHHVRFSHWDEAA